MTRALAVLALSAGLAGCPDKGKPHPQTGVTPDRPARVDPPPPTTTVRRHPGHEHPHGAHPHPGNAHHHHPHPHPHLAGANGHHHPY